MGDGPIKSVAEIVEESYQGRRWNPGEGRRKVVELPRGNILDINVPFSPAHGSGWNITIGGTDDLVLQEIVNFLQREETLHGVSVDTRYCERCGSDEHYTSECD